MTINAELLIELIDSTVSAREKVEKRMSELREELESLTDDIDSLNLEEQGYRLALARRFPTAHAPGEESAPGTRTPLLSLDGDLAARSRSDAVETAVRMIARDAPAASPTAIEEFLHERGRDDTRDAIGAALAYLKRTNRVTRVSRGQWQPREVA